MRRASDKFRQLSDISPTAVGDATCRFLRRRHPFRTADLVAADLAAFGVKAGTIAKMLERGSTPSTTLWLALTFVYGPEILCAVLPSPPAWLDIAQRAERQQVLEAQLLALTRELEALR